MPSRNAMLEIDNVPQRQEREWALGQIKYAVLETTGTVSIVPTDKDFEVLLDRKLQPILKHLQAMEASQLRAGG